MTFKEIQEIVKLVGKSNLTEFKVKKKDFEISIRTEKYSKSVNPSIVQAAPIIAPAPAAPSTASPIASQAATSQDSSSEEQADDSNLIEVKSPIVGTFYRSAGPDKPPFIKVGDSIDIGSVVCIVEAMKLFNEIESEVSGKVVKVMIEDANPVEYDQVLFLVDPKG